MEIKKKSLSHFILLALEKTIDGFMLIEDFGHNPGRYAYGDPSTLKKSALAAAIKRLREKGFIEKEIVSDKLVIRLTNLGREILEDSFEPKVWDGKWRIVIFDIPEKHKVVRDLFRRNLKYWGFKLWQQSVWITKKNITEKLTKLIDQLGIRDWVAVIESDNKAFNNIKLSGR